MDLSDARHNIHSLVVMGDMVEYDEECWDLIRRSWRLIQEELNWTSRQKGKVTCMDCNKVLSKNEGHQCLNRWIW
jgi:hypothetical protein